MGLGKFIRRAGKTIAKGARITGKVAYDVGKQVGQSIGLVKPDEDPQMAAQREQLKEQAKQLNRQFGIEAEQYKQQEERFKEQAKSSIAEAVGMLGATGQLKYVAPGETVKMGDTGPEVEKGSKIAKDLENATPEERKAVLGGMEGKSLEDQRQESFNKMAWVAKRIARNFGGSWRKKKSDKQAGAAPAATGTSGAATGASDEVIGIQQTAGAQATGSALMNLSQYRDMMERERRDFVRTAQTNLRTTLLQKQSAEQGAARMQEAINKLRNKTQISRAIGFAGGVAGLAIGGPTGFSTGAQIGSFLGGGY